VLSSLADEAVVIVDGLAGGAMPDEIARDASRLRIVSLVHHPLAKETGLAADVAARLAISERRTLDVVRHVVVTSAATAALLTSEFGVAANRLSTIEPGTDPAPKATGSESSTVEILCVASVTPRKGHVALVRALAQLVDLDWHLTCVGSLERDAATARSVRDAVREAGLAGRVSFVAELMDRDQLDPYYQRADLFALPTEYEGYGMAVAEALARGLPVVSTPTGGIADLVGSDAGLLVQAGDVAGLAAALRQLIANPAERARFASAAWRARKRLPAWDAAAEKMAAVIDRVANS
jgi:glycosyltransferase involved in cell wall biosynthesis